MEKQKLSRFIGKYNLAGLIESVKWESKGGDLETNFISDDKSMMGNLKMKDFGYDDAEFGIFDTTKLTKMLGVLGTDVEFDVNKVNDKSVSLKFKDSSTSVNYMLADLSVIPATPNLKNLPEFDATINLGSDFVAKFIRAKGALADEERFHFLKKGKQSQIVLGYSSINTNRIVIDVEAEVDGDVDIEPIPFSATYFKEILVANKDASDGVLQISSKGLAKVTFTVDEYESNYYIVSKA